MHFGLLSFVGEEEAFPRLNVVDSPPEVAFGLPLFAISRKSDIGLSFFQCFFSANVNHGGGLDLGLFYLKIIT